MSIDHNSRGSMGRRSPAIIQIVARYGCLALLAWQVVGSEGAWAQPAFAPPPPPQVSAVRGIYDPAQSQPSPVTVAPPATAPVAAPVAAPASDITPDRFGWGSAFGRWRDRGPG